MSYQDLLDFITSTMQPQHIYQPVMLRVLLESGGSATEHQIAEALLDEDPRQVEHYRGITRPLLLALVLMAIGPFRTELIGA